ncbi:hypothetical protein [Chenggangzhangella methanolivorans]|uniref:Uncharacterized protein n=1 Tax=Chenggangzhangella methanolivorans TaxID=1437009 RepID=A0A9E6R5N8_9HYPH|nr:hypothetical protein [Chenggangzhangella methanolivorans]QZN98314.1 hypothetical protein K6K41_14380 [Chenggangzhangella methanolivorans]
MLIAIGQALYGVSFSSNMAHDTRYSSRSIQRWTSGQHPVPQDMWVELDRIAEFRLFQLEGLRELLALECEAVRADRLKRKTSTMH